jgi:hypothetical protein
MPKLLAVTSVSLSYFNTIFLGALIPQAEVVTSGYIFVSRDSFYADMLSI